MCVCEFDVLLVIHHGFLCSVGVQSTHVDALANALSNTPTRLLLCWLQNLSAICKIPVVVKRNVWGKGGCLL